jgi:hypothetical protein
VIGRQVPCGGETSGDEASGRSSLKGWMSGSSQSLDHRCRHTLTPRQTPRRRPGDGDLNRSRHAGGRVAHDRSHPSPAGSRRRRVVLPRSIRCADRLKTRS